MDAAQSLNIIFPRKLKFGKGVLNALPEDIIALPAKRVFILTIDPLLNLLQPLIAQLRTSDIQVEINTAILNEPSFSDFEKVLQHAKAFDADLVAGIGGGSVLDIAKLVAAQLKNDQPLNEIVGNGLLNVRQTPLICVPATAGTGSEVSPNSILINDADHQKNGIISPYLVPDVVYVDPLLTMSVPGSITAATGLDALTHCLEAYTNKFAHPFIDMYAIEGVKLIAANIDQAVKDGSDEEARTHVAMGSLLGGFCLGPVNTAAVHALAYPLGTGFNLPHGLSNALMLPYVMRYNIPALPGKYARVAEAIGAERQATDLQTAKEGVKKIESIIASCGIPARLRDTGIPKEAIPQIAADAMKITRLLKNNPRPLAYEDALEIYNNAY